MNLLAGSSFKYVRRQIDTISSENAAAGKLLFMMPSLPPAVVLQIGSRLADFCAARPQMRAPLIRVSMSLTRDWGKESSLALQEAARQVLERGWVDDRQNLTTYRNIIPDGDLSLVVLLIGVDRVTDSSSMEDFHHCDLRAIWKDELCESFADWTRARLELAHVAFEEDTIQRFDSILKPIVDRGLCDVLQVSSLLEELDLSTAQVGRDAEEALLTGLKALGLPEFSSFRFSSAKAFGAYLDSALGFFSYDDYLKKLDRDNAIRAVETFQAQNASGEGLDPNSRRPFSTDKELFDNLKRYIETADPACRSRLLGCDFVIIRDEILSSRSPKDPDKPKQKAASVSKLSGGPIEVVLSALWTSLGEFKRAARECGVFAHEALTSIRIESVIFKHDADGASAADRTANAIVYLKRLLGGVDQLLQEHLLGLLKSDSLEIQSRLVKANLDCQSARTAEPCLQFSITIEGSGITRPVVKQFAWRLPEIQPYRVADELIKWAVAAVSTAQLTDGYCLPAFTVPHYEELMLAKDDEETRRILLQCTREDDTRVSNLLKAPDLDSHDPLLPRMRQLALAYDYFIQTASSAGLHSALHDKWDDLRKAYESVASAYLNDARCGRSPMATLLFRSFLIVAGRGRGVADRWFWEPYEPSCVVTVLHPVLLEMLWANVLYLFTSFSAIARRELEAPGTQTFREITWQGYVDLATIHMPLSGLVKDRNRILDTDVRGEGLIHRIGTSADTEASLTTRLLLRYDAFDEEDISDIELFHKTRESILFSRVLEDYHKLHPHADDGLSVAVYQNGSIQPIIAAVDQFLRQVTENRGVSAKHYAMAVTVFTEASDDSSVSRWVAQWKERWDAAENQASMSHYRQCQLSIAHRIVTEDNHYRQFRQLISGSFEVDIAFLNGFIRAGSQGNEFEPVAPYDVRTRTLKFPILEKSFCAFRDPGRRLQRARVLSNRQFRLSTFHAEVMARLKSREVPLETQHVVLGYGDYTPWQNVVDALHQKAGWVVCIDPSIDERLIAEKGRDNPEAREIIGFGSGVGAHGEANFTISTEQFRLSDVLHKLEGAIRELFTGWTADEYRRVARSVLLESRRLSGLSLVRATGVGQYVRDFMAYALTRRLLGSGTDVLCDQVVSLDAYQHWFDSAESGTRPDLLWLVARISDGGRIQLDVRLIECKLAKMSDAHLDKAREQLENGIRRLASVFLPLMPRVEEYGPEDQRPDQRYWWLQLHRLIASKAEIAERDQTRVLTALEHLAEGDFDIEWRASVVTYWTDQLSSEIVRTNSWPYSVAGQAIDIGVVAAGTEFVRFLSDEVTSFRIPWAGKSAVFRASKDHPFDPEGTDNNEEAPREPSDHSPSTPHRPSSDTSGGANDVEGGTGPAPPITAPSLELPARIYLGTTTPGSRRVYWEFGHRELNNRHMLIFGSSGMGKTYTIQCLLLELGRARQNSLIVDYTNGFFDNQLEGEFKRVLNPAQHIVRREALAINPFRQQAEMIGDELLPEVPSSTAQRVSGVFSEVYSFGDQQKAALYQAVKTGLELAGNRGMTLDGLIPRLEHLAEEKGTQAQAASSVISKLRPFLDQNPFGAEDPESWQRLFSDPLHRCHVIQLAGFMKDAARLVTEFSLIDLYWFYRSRGTQSNPRVVVLDEVQNLDHREESPLAQLLREGRKFGFSLILATQIMSNLERDERDRLFNAAHKLFFRPADTEMRTYAEIASVSTGDKADVWLTRLASLKKGECYSLGPSLNEANGKLEVRAFKVQIAPLLERIGDA